MDTTVAAIWYHAGTIGLSVTSIDATIRAESVR
jgi:hypothetical protein